MKLLGWMHRKFRQNSGEPFAIINGLGHSCTCLSKQTSFDEQLQEQQQFYHPNANTYSSKPSSRHNHPQKENLLQKSFVGMDSAIIEENVEYFTYDGHDSSSAAIAISGFFDGLLNIGTLGLGQHQLDSEPETPTFAVENVNEKETELTENDLKLINEELEKVLNADAKREDDRFYCKDSPSAKTDNDSTITLGGSTDQAVNRNDGGKQTPLQGYLFGSPVDLPAETTIGSRKEHRPSLGELFQINKLGEVKKNDNCKEDYHKRHTAGENYKSIKKFLKWRSLKSSTPTAASVSAENKLQKLLQMFSRKVHPESSAATQRSQKTHKNETKNNTSKAPSYSSNYYQGNNAARVVTNEDIMLFPTQSHQTQREGTITRDHILSHDNHSNSPPFEVNRSGSSGNREYWIKTDADYLVLEL
ncbi:protein LAZY 1-like isoform X1 [Papaver somniferum]|uniref:protein LAZY 1-like isoform X1 n=1 Tax=Papaver somniferum TaxID=3469 RepID=UPI000E6FB8DD|nr:protein LAZY 1-like isoform X1 [Papaver somniferum]